MTNKQLWRNKGDVDYIRIEARPPRENKLGITIELDWLPEGDSGAYEAFKALIKAKLSKKTEEESRAFYEGLLQFAMLHGAWLDEEEKEKPRGPEAEDADVGGVVGEHEGSEG